MLPAGYSGFIQMMLDDLAALEPPWQLTTADVRHVWHQVARYLKPFRIHAEPGHVYNARLFHRRLGHCDMVIIDYGGPIALEAGTLGSFSLLQVPLRGTFSCRAGDQLLNVPALSAQLVSPQVPLTMRWSADCRLLAVRFNALTGLQALSSPAHPLGQLCDLAGPVGASLGRALHFAAGEAAHGRLFASSDTARQQTDALLVAATHDAFAAEAATRQTVPPALARALAAAKAGLDQPLTLGQLAASAGIGKSQLSQLFRQQLGQSPMGWVQQQRLDAVHAALKAPQGDGVTATALRWGFGHMGRFAALYARRFGEQPRQTVQRARAISPSAAE